MFSLTFQKHCIFTFKYSTLWGFQNAVLNSPPPELVYVCPCSQTKQGPHRVEIRYVPADHVAMVFDVNKNL